MSISSQIQCLFKIKVFKVEKFISADFLSLPYRWSGIGDPTGWVASELVSGKRCYFDGKTFRNVKGEEMDVENSLLSSMPQGSSIDGNLRYFFAICNDAATSNSLHLIFRQVKRS